MKSIEQIDAEIAQVEKELEYTEGEPTEVYARIVGYYRSVRNWNRGKREEFNHRKMFSENNSRIYAVSLNDASIA